MDSTCLRKAPGSPLFPQLPMEVVGGVEDRQARGISPSLASTPMPAYDLRKEGEPPQPCQEKPRETGGQWAGVEAVLRQFYGEDPARGWEKTPFPSLKRKENCLQTSSYLPLPRTERKAHLTMPYMCLCGEEKRK